MLGRNSNKFRNGSLRLQNWDYGSKAHYFITICTKNREHFFGKIQDTKVELSSIGLIVQEEWIKTPIVRPDMNLTLGNFVVMPNHFHGIIHIGKNQYNKSLMLKEKVPNSLGPQSKNLAAIIRGFKSSVTTVVRKGGNQEFAWQPRFYEHIIKDDQAYYRIKKYIENNPKNWKEDSFY